MSSTFHIGSKIKQVWKRSGLKGSEFAKRLHRQRQSIYHLFKQESIDTHLLKTISQVLEHDFFLDYSEQLGMKVPDSVICSDVPMKTLSGSIDRLSEEIRRLAEIQHKKDT